MEVYSLIIPEFGVFTLLIGKRHFCCLILYIVVALSAAYFTFCCELFWHHKCVSKTNLPSGLLAHRFKHGYGDCERLHSHSSKPK